MTNKHKNVPELRFKGFRDDWKLCALGELSSLRGGFAFSSEKFRAKGVPIVRISNILPTGEIGGDYVFYDEEVKDENYLLPNKAAVLAMSGATTGKVSILDNPQNKKIYQNQRVGYFTKKDSTDYGFVSTLVRSHLFINQLNSVLVAGAQPNVSSRDIDSFEFKVPMQIKEQQKIGLFFANLDHLITLHQRKLELLKEQKKAFLQKMFPKNGETVPELRFEGFADAWEQHKLEALASFSKGSGYTKKDLVISGKPIILYGRLYTNYELIISNVDTFVSEVVQSVVSSGNEVIVPASGESSEDIARASVVGKSDIILGGDLNIIKPINFIDPIFLALTISNGSQKKELSKRAQGKSVVHLHNSDLKKINLLYPKLVEQQKIGNFFKQLDNTIVLHQRKLELLKEQKKGFLQKMFV